MVSTREVGSSVRPDPAAGFALVRGLALYLLSALSAGAALAAWPRPSSTALALVVALATAAATVLGESAAPGLADAQRLWRARGRLLFAVGYAALIVLAAFVASAVPEPALLAREAMVFAALQPAVLLVGGALADPRLSLANALALVVLATLRGGPIAAVAALGAFVLTAAFLAGDNGARVLGAYAARRGPGLAPMLGETVTLAAPVAAGLGLFLWMVPPRGWASIRFSGGPEADLPRRAYLLLFVACMIGAGAMGLAAQFLRRRGGMTPPTEELVEVVAIEDEALPEAGTGAQDIIPGARGDVVRAYVGFLRAAAGLGRPRAASATPREYAASLGELEGLAALTALFMDARYGREEPDPAAVAAAESAARAAAGALAARRTPPRRASARR